MRRILTSVSLLVALLLLAGCASAPKRPAPKPATGDPLVDGKNALESAPEKDRVLWEYRTALVAMRRGEFNEAKPLLDSAIARISNIMGKDASARKARSMFSAEAKKTFIGEPYERVMAYYYRGILYWMDGEPDNARACFRSAQLEDSDTQDKHYSSDYVLLDYLDGFASVKLAGDGSDCLKRAQSFAKISAPPSYDPKANLLLFADFGPGPTKYAMGEYAQYLMFREGRTPIRTVQVQVDGKTYKLRPYDDLYFQATTRGGRVMDHILANKASFRTATDAAGDAGLIGGLVLSQQRQTREAALGLAAAGLLSKIVSATTTPEADTRSWDNLPLYLTFAALELPPGTHTLTVDFLDEANRMIAGQTKTITVNVPADSDKVVYVSDKSKTPLNE
jgi:tetratricopeptide (TPR) repeat protein